MSARLRQCFDYLSMKVFSSVYSADDIIQTNPKLLRVCTALMQRVQKIAFEKFERHLNMLSLDTPKAAQERDGDIRFDSATGEVKDDEESYMYDQCAEFGDDCINKAKKASDFKIAARTKIIEQFIK